MCRFLFRVFLCLSLFLACGLHTVKELKELNVLTGFFANQWKPGGFDQLKEEIDKVLGKKYRIKTIDICLGTGGKEEELRNGWRVIDTLKNSLIKNSKIENIVKNYDGGEDLNKKPEFVGIFSSVSALIARCTLQWYAKKIPFKMRHLISICSPQCGIDAAPPDGIYENPVENACAEVQKFTTDSIMADAKSSPDNPAKPSWLLSNAANIFGNLVDINKIAWKTLYQPCVQENWISLWRDVNHFEDYQSCAPKNTPPFLPFFNNELRPLDAEKYAQDLALSRENMKQTEFFDFIASDNDTSMPKATALCREKISKNTYRKRDKFLTRIGIDPQKTKFYTVKGAGHQCHTNPGIIRAVAGCLEDRWG